jgi:hypothetical protein
MHCPAFTHIVIAGRDPAIHSSGARQGNRI